MVKTVSPKHSVDADATFDESPLMMATFTTLSLLHCITLDSEKATAMMSSRLLLRLYLGTMRTEMVLITIPVFLVGFILPTLGSIPLHCQRRKFFQSASWSRLPLGMFSMWYVGPNSPKHITDFYSQISMQDHLDGGISVLIQCPGTQASSTLTPDKIAVDLYIMLRELHAEQEQLSGEVTVMVQAFTYEFAIPHIHCFTERCHLEAVKPFIHRCAFIFLQETFTLTGSLQFL